MDLLILAGSNLIAYISLLILNLHIKSKFNQKLEDYKKDNQKTIELFKNELFKKNRRFELKYDICKGFANAITQLHWIIEIKDYSRLFDSYENIMEKGSLVYNFYGDKVKKRIDDTLKIFSEVIKKRNEIIKELNELLGKRISIDQEKEYFTKMLSGKNAEQFFKAVEINIKEKEVYEKQQETWNEYINTIKSGISQIETMCQNILTEMASELKIDF